jgi:hypothetical protein
MLSLKGDLMMCGDGRIMFRNLNEVDWYTVFSNEMNFAHTVLLHASSDSLTLSDFRS